MPTIIIIGVLYILWNVYKHYRDKRKEEEEEMRTYNFSEMGAQNRAENVSSGNKTETNSATDKKDNPTGEGEAPQQIPDYSYETVALMSSALTGLGCQPTDHGDKTIAVQYQGENFLIECFGRFARIWDPQWSGIMANDPNLPNLRDAINKTNYQFGPTILLGDPNEDGMIGIHSRYDIMIHPSFPDQSQYLQAVFNSFFDIKKWLSQSCQELKAQQMETQRKRRPVGFTSQEAE